MASWKLFGYVQCNIKTRQKLKLHFANLPPFFENSLVKLKDIGKLLKQYAEEDDLMSQPQKLPISRCRLRNVTLSTPVLKSYLEWALVCTNIFRLLEYTPKKCFNKFVQSTVDARI